MKRFKEYFFITLGTLFVAIGVKLFLEPNEIAAGGVTGASIIINYFIPSLGTGTIMLILNVILFIIAFLVLGNKFGAKTIYATLVLAGIVAILDNIIPKGTAITDDLFLAAFFGTLMSGIGMAIVFNQNASTGGTDIIAKILNKFFHVDMGKALIIIDFIITVSALFAFGANVAMYALISVIMNGFVIDGVIEGLNLSKAVFIISSKIDEISDYIIKDLNRSCTWFKCVGAYTKQDKYLMYAVLNRKEFIKLKKFIKNIDDKAFITVHDAREVLGEGFKDIIGDE